MKQFGIKLATLLMCGALIAGCQADTENSTSSSEENETGEAVETMNQQAENADLDTPEVIAGLDTVLETINKLQKVVKDTPKDVKRINEIGKELDENWDKIEKAVEKRDPEKYEYIEESLYPLIAVAKKATPEIDKINQFIEETTKKLKDYKEKISS